MSKKSTEEEENIHNVSVLPAKEEKSKKEPYHAEEVLQSFSYKLGEDDITFLHADEGRIIRLQLDYLKAELKMREHNIHHTIVVFGSTKISEPDIAIKQMKAAEKELKDSPQSKELIIALSRAESMVRKSIYYAEARKFGQLVGQSGQGPSDCHVTLMTGGGPGIMEAANRGAFEIGAKSIGLNIQLPHEQFPNPYVTPDLCFKFHYFAMRKLHFMQHAKALVVFPGGFGTLDELFETLTLIQTGKSEKIPIVLISQEYWRRVIDFDFLLDEGAINPSDLETFSYADSAEEAWDKILQWHKKNGTALF